MGTQSRWDEPWPLAWRAPVYADAETALSALLSALPRLKWKVVPVEATEKMKYTAARRAHARDEEIYADMLAASPDLTDEAKEQGR